MRRAAVSIPANVAEGYCRRNTKVYAHHVSVALGSHAEGGGITVDDGLVALVTRRRRKLGPGSPLKAVGAAQTMQQLVDDAPPALVDEARTQGHTWQEIGAVLGTTRQAAFQRFGKENPSPGLP